VYSTLNLSKDIKLIISDFDGVFTDGGVYIAEDKTTSKKVNYKDIMGLSIAVKNGYKIAFVSGDKSAAIEVIAERFGIKDVYMDIRDKAAVVEKLMKKYELSPQEVLYVGDDINDINGMLMVDYRVAPPNANWKVKKVEGIQITQNVGADGVFREIIDNLIEQQV